MRAFLILLFIVSFVLIPASSTSCELIRCQSGTKCVEDCSNGPCMASCVPNPLPQVEPPGCENLQCEQGTTCLEDCSTGVCVASCQPIDVHISVCSLVDCPEGTTCMEDCSSGECFPSCVTSPTQPQSEPSFPPACAAVTCLPGGYCIVGDDGNPKCVSFQEYICSSAQCPEGLVCLASRQECLTTPCPQYSCLQPGHSSCPQADPCIDSCPEIYAPVCASNGKTYSSGCKLTIENCNQRTNFTVLHQGECQEIPTPQSACDSASCDRGEVCFEDPKYCLTTPCPQYECVSLEECPLFKCSSGGEAVCGSDGVTYPNLCQLNQTMCREHRIIRFLHLGECEGSSNPCDTANCGASEICLREPKYCIAPPCPQFSCVPCSRCDEASCPPSYEPVCGSDGVSYSNECRLRIASCLERRVISVLKEGECDPQGSQPQSACEAVDCGDAFICIEDPKNCTQITKRDEPSETPIGEGEGEGEGEGGETEMGGAGVGQESCQQFACYPKSQCPEICPLNYQPFCGSDGKTYGNQCILAMAICETKRVITIVHSGPCVGIGI